MLAILLLFGRESEVNMDTVESTQQTQNVFHSMQSSPSTFSGKVLIFFVIVILLGVGSGYILSKHNAVTVPSSATTAGTNGSSLVKGATYGSGDSATFKDTAEGVVQKGGIGDEGQFHLVRPGGDSQNVYMTSSLVDLSQFIGHKVKVWGATQKAQVAGWLMDVGKVEVEQ